MTKNKSLFSGVGDGNRVKSIRLQGDKHTQGKKGKRRTVNAARRVQTESPRQSAGLGAGAGARRRGRWAGQEALGQQGQVSPGDLGSRCKAKPQLGQRTLAEAARGAEWPRRLPLHRTWALGTRAAWQGLSLLSCILG